MRLKKHQLTTLGEKIIEEERGVRGVDADEGGPEVFEPPCGISSSQPCEGTQD